MLSSFDVKPYDDKEVVTKPNTIILGPYSVEPYDSKDEVIQDKGNNARAIQRTTIS